MNENAVNYAGNFFLVVNGVLRDSGGDILMLHYKRFNGWGLPGGKVDPGETPIQAVKREFVEETGLEVEVIGLLGAIEYSLKPENYTLNVLYEVKLVKGNPTNVEPEKHDSLEYRKPADLPQNFAKVCSAR